MTRWKLKCWDWKMMSEFFEERGESVPREDGDVFSVLGRVAAIDQPGMGGFTGLEFRPPEVEAFEGI